MITVNGALDPLTSPQQEVSYENAVAEAGCSEYYRLYTAAGGAHGDPPVIDEVLIRFWETSRLPSLLVIYPLLKQQKNTTLSSFFISFLF